ncbi:MAG: MATE family efflux transporter [Clostridia bacterium]|nr:MATE family efflux transporter [Clostridia bacterium]
MKEDDWMEEVKKSAEVQEQQETPEQALARANEAIVKAAREYQAQPFLKRMFSRQNRVPHDMTKGELGRDILHIAWPSMVELFLQSLAGIVDLMMVGQLGAWAISSVGLANQPKFIMMAVMVALNAGTTALVARFRGAGDRENANRVVRQGLLLTLVFGLGISSIIFIFAEPLVQFMGAAETATLVGGTIYLKYQAAGFICVAFSAGVTAALRGVGQTRVSMVYNMVGNVANVILNYGLIYGNFGLPRMEVAGASLATILGQAIAMVFAFIVLLKGRGGFLKLEPRKGFKPDFQLIKRILHIGIPSMFEQFAMRLGMILFTKTVAVLGTVQFAAHQVCMNLQSLTMMNGQGFGIAATALLGRSMGQGRIDKAHAYTKRCRRFSLYLSLGLSAFFLFLGRYAIMMYNSDPAIITAGLTIMPIMALLQPLQGAQM